MRLIDKIYGYGSDLDKVLEEVKAEYNTKRRESLYGMDFRDLEVIQTSVIEASLNLSIVYHVVLVYEYEDPDSRFISSKGVLKERTFGEEYTVIPGFPVRELIDS